MNYGKYRVASSKELEEELGIDGLMRRKPSCADAK
jgi:hypothetical protein